MSLLRHPPDDDELASEIEDLFRGPGLDIPQERPDKWDQVYDINNVKEPFRHYIIALLNQYVDAFSLHPLDIGRVEDPDLAMSIIVKELPPRQKTFPLPEPLVKHMRHIIHELVELDVLTPGISPVSAPCFLVPRNSAEKTKLQQMKREGNVDYDSIRYRLCADYRALNKTILNNWAGDSPVSHVYSMLKGRAYISIFDVSQAFFQIPVKPECQYLTCISLSNGLGSFKFRAAPMGVSCSPAALQHAMAQTLNPRKKHPTRPGYITEPVYPNNICFYADDVIVVASDPDEMAKVLEALFQRLIKVGFKLGLKKAIFYEHDKSLEILGFDVDSSGKTITETKLRIAREMARPTTLHALQQCIGFFGYLSGHVPAYQDMICALTDALGTCKGKLHWTPNMETAFNNLKTAIAQNIKLYHINFQEPLYVQSDASDHAAGMVLLQFDGQVRVISFHSYKWPKAIKAKYSIVAKEALALTLAIKKWLPELMAVRHRVAIVDSYAVTYILSGSRAGNSRLGRLAMTLLSMPIHIVIRHRSGAQNVGPDYLSRYFYQHTPHLKLKNVNTIQKEQMKAPPFQEGDITTMERINQMVHEDKDYVRSFLQNPADADRLPPSQMVAEIHSLDYDLIRTLYFDQSMEAEAQRPLLQSMFCEVEHGVNYLSLAAKEIRWETIIKAQCRDRHLSRLRETAMQGDDNRYRIHNGMLCKRRYPDKDWDHPGNSLIMIPHSGEIISYLIGAYHFGHHGVTKITAALKNTFYIPRMRRHVRDFCLGCAICARLRLKTFPRNPHAHLYQPSSPMEILDVDFLYMDPVGRHRYILNIVDRYSKKLFSVATTGMTSKIVIRCLRQLFSMFGAPQYICADNQISLLRSRESMTFLSEWGTCIKSGLPYNSRSQALVETLNGSLRYMLQALGMQHNTAKWPELLPLALYLHNSAPVSSLPGHLTPDAVFFGRSTERFPLGRHKVAGHVLPEQNYHILEDTHKANQRAIDQFLKHKRLKEEHKPAPRGATFKFKTGEFVYFRQFTPGLKKGTGVKYTNTIYQIERVYHDWIVIRDIYRVTSPPYTITTSRYFLKPFSPRPAFLFDHVKDDMKAIGKPLHISDFPTGTQGPVPSVYRNKPRQNKLTKPVRPPATSSAILGRSHSPADDGSSPNESEPDDQTSSHTASMADTAVRSHPAQPQILPGPSESESSDESSDAPRGLVNWLKGALRMQGRQTRRGTKF